MMTIRREIEISDNVSKNILRIETEYNVNNELHLETLSMRHAERSIKFGESDVFREIFSVRSDKKPLIFTCERHNNRLLIGNIGVIEIVGGNDGFEVIGFEFNKEKNDTKSYFSKVRKGSFDRIVDFFIQGR